MIVYADILFLVNFSLNWFSLLLTSRLTKHRCKAVNGLCAAGVGALAGVITLFFPNTLSVTLTEIASTFLMCAIAFNTSGFPAYAKLCCCLFASGITLGGSLTLVYSFFNRAGIEFKGQSDASSAVFILLSFVITVAALVFERVMRTQKSSGNTHLKIEYKGKCAVLPCFTDSGNLLCEPISGRPAVVVSADMLAGLLPKDILYADAASALACKQSSRLRFIPASGVCGTSLLIGFIPDKLTLEGDFHKVLDAIIAIDKSKDGASRRFAIIPSSVL